MRKFLVSIISDFGRFELGVLGVSAGEAVKFAMSALHVQTGPVGSFAIICKEAK